MFRRLLALPLALITAACSQPAPPPSAGGEAGSQVTPSLDATTLRATVTRDTSAFMKSKPCELLTSDEQATLGLEPPGTPERVADGFTCAWNGAGYGLMINISPARTLASVEAGRPGQRISIAGRAASLAQGDGQFAGLCDLSMDITRIASAIVLLSRYDKDSNVACLNAIKVAALLHPRLPGS